MEPETLRPTLTSTGWFEDEPTLKDDVTDPLLAEVGANTIDPTGKATKKEPKSHHNGSLLKEINLLGGSSIIGTPLL